MEKEVGKLLDMAIFDIAIRLQNELVLTCPVDTGRLRSSIKVKPTKRGLIIFMVDYGRFVEFGTPPRIIKPTTKKALKFEVGRVKRLEEGGPKGGARIVFAKKVKHPGTRPNPFIRTAINTKLKRIIIEELTRVSRG